MRANVSVLGAGAWGTAVACALAPRHEVLLWARDRLQVESIARDRRNARYLPEIALPAPVQVTVDLPAALAHAGGDLIVLATPTAALREIAASIAAAAAPAAVVWLCKGLERGTSALAHEVVREVLDARMSGPLSGPSFAQEVARGLPTALTVAGTAEFCEHVTRIVHGGALRIYATDDVVGVEIGGAVKNVLAIAAGIADALGLGHNARAALLTRGLAEITRLGVALGARAETFMGLTGLGDLILTATSDQSRNRQVGLMLGRGMPLAQALESLGHVAEGVWSAPAVAARARALGVDMPITDAVCAVLDGKLTPPAAIEKLLARDPKREGASG